MDDPVPISRRSFNERLLGNLPSPPAEREQLQELARKEGAAFGRVLVSRGLLTLEGLRRAYEEMCGFPAFLPEPEGQRSVPGELLPLSFMRARLVVPVQVSDGTLTVAMADPLDVDAREAVARATGKRVEVLAGTEEQVREAIEKAYGESASSMERIVEQVSEEATESAADEKVEQLIGVASEAPIIRLVNFIMARAIERGASDIHMEPYEKALRIRYRIDGVLEDVESPP
ncbi:MAG: hypothetical protein C4529_12540, partial [Deltaproteobacteria bacterium]